MCKYCVSQCLVSVMGSNSPPIGCVLGGETTRPRWDPVDEQSTKHVLGRCACTYLPLNQDETPTVTVSREEFNRTMLNNHEENLQEMAGNLAALSDRVEELEKKVQELEQMLQNHIHYIAGTTGKPARREK